MARQIRNLSDECRTFCRYLAGCEPSHAIVERYAEAHRKLAATVGGWDSAAVDFVRRRPWALPYLDAACGLRRPKDPLRRKLLLATAIMETSLDYADAFLPVRVTRMRLVARAAWIALVAGLRAVAGIVILWWVESRGRRR